MIDELKNYNIETMLYDDDVYFKLSDVCIEMDDNIVYKKFIEDEYFITEINDELWFTKNGIEYYFLHFGQYGMNWYERLNYIYTYAFGDKFDMSS